jgi:translation initiation factor IF-2
MSDGEEKDKEQALTLKRPGRLELRKTVETGQVRQSFSHGRSKAVTVEVRRKRTFAPGAGGRMTEVKAVPEEGAAAEASPAVVPDENALTEPIVADTQTARRSPAPKTLTTEEKEARARALGMALKADQEARKQAEIEVEARLAAEREAAAQLAAEEEAKRLAREESEPAAETIPQVAPPKVETRPPERTRLELVEEPDKAHERGRRGKGEARRSSLAARRGPQRRRGGKLTISQALADEDRVRSLASVRRAREREREKRATRPTLPSEPTKVVREVVVPEFITVQELANRMAVRSAEVIKAAMKIGSMVTINESIDGDTAELLVDEFGHKSKRVSAADVELGLSGVPDAKGTLKPRPPIVTVMGHVDHGKTTLLDALRETSVATGEAGGITQHIGAYQVALESGARVTFIDTPGHEAFTAMRARGAGVTDIVVLVVAAEDGVMPQTIEAINHAKAADVPIVVAINKIDRPNANPDTVRNELLQHGIVVEELGGDVQSVEVSAMKKLNLDKLIEAILLQAELLDLTANPDRTAEGIVVEAELDRGRGPLATVLVQRGTLHVGEVVVAGSHWARVRALIDDLGDKVEQAGPADPVEILGLNGVPSAGDEVVVVESERRAREVTEYRQQRLSEVRAAAGARGTLEQMFANVSAGEEATLPVVLKADVQGSVEAIRSSLENLGTDEVSVQLLHDGVGGINEADVTLAQASNALIIGFNVRANAQARELARRDNVEIRYYSVIYEVIDDVKAALSGLLAPTLREHIVGNAQVLEVFDITKLGKIAGCRVTDGTIKRGAKVRLLRDDTVIYEGRLATLRRFKDDVRQVKEGLECGMSFENYHDIRIGDVIESVEVEEVARTL